MAISAKSSRKGRTGRPGNVDCSVTVDPGTFLRKLARATAWGGDVEAFIGLDGSVVPGSPDEESDPNDPGRWSVNYLWRELLSKFDDGKSSDGKRDSAMEKFAEAEVQCGLANARLSRMVGLPVDLAVTDIERTLCLARRKIRGILGKFSWDHAARGFGFSTGASTRCGRVASTVPHKYSGTPETTFSNSDLAWACVMSNALWKRSLCSEEGPMHLTMVKGNRVTTVPKNYKTDRGIAIEPDMNMYVQRGLGNLIRERLRRVGVNLNSQDTNQDLAYYGSVKGSVATIDLKMASDSVCLELVRFLLPTTWCAALEQCRSAIGVLPSGEEVLYRKFSSMGNGYTFELESLIFYGLSLAVCELHGIETHLVSVYGDDIIVPSAAAQHLIEVLDFCGFKTNESKTFISGSFRESCGKHFLAGHDVQPFYVKAWPNKLSELFLLHNKLYRWLQRQQWNPVVDLAEAESLLGYLRSCAPCQWRKPRIPDKVGDGAFIGTFDQCTPKLADTYVPGKLGKRDGFEGYVVKVLAGMVVKADFHEVILGSGESLTLYGTYNSREFKARKYSPTSVGRLCQSLLGVGRSHNTIFSTPFEGGVDLPPRDRKSVV